MTKKSIRYAKENDREKRERKVEGDRIDLKILDFLSYTYTHPIQLKK